MKKVLCFLLVCLLVCMSAFAASDIDYYYNGVFSQIYLSGVSEGEHKDSPVTIVIYDEETAGEGITADNIKNLYQVTPDAYGNWEINIPAPGDISPYQIKLNQSGSLTAPTLNKVTTVSEAIDIEYISAAAKDIINTQVMFRNPFGMRMDIMTVVAQYDKDGNLVDAQRIDVLSSEKELEKQLNYDYDEKAEYAKVFVWAQENLTPITDDLYAEPYINYRNSIGNVFTKLENGEPVTLVFLGGSVTWGAGATNNNETSWRALTEKWFRQQYPDADITSINSAIGDTGSFFGSVRLEQDVLQYNPDMVFVMFPVNDLAIERYEVSVQRNMEDIIRRIREHSPQTDIMMEYDTNVEKANYGEYNGTVYENNTYVMCDWHETVAQKYDITTVNMGEYLADVIREEKPETETDGYVWDKYFSDTVHPADNGYAVMAAQVQKVLERAKANAPQSCIDYEMPDDRIFGAPLNPEVYLAGTDGFLADGGSLIDRVWVGDFNRSYQLNPGQSLSFSIEGTNIGVVKERRDDATGTYAFNIDNGTKTGTIAPGDRAPVKIAESLADGTHTVTIINNSNYTAFFYGIYTWE